MKPVTPLVAIYPGTFDPMTLGHADLMSRAARLFPRLVVAVAYAHHKKTLFSPEERLQMAADAASSLDNVDVVAFDGLLSDFARAQGASVVVRGLRAVSDFEYESQLAGMNRHLMPEVESLFLTPSDQFQFVSGSLVREIAMLGGDVSKFVSPDVAERLRQRAARG